MRIESFNDGPLSFVLQFELDFGQEFIPLKELKFRGNFFSPDGRLNANFELILDDTALRLAMIRRLHIVAQKCLEVSTKIRKEIEAGRK